MILKYIGPKALPYKLNTPIPYLSRSEHIGTLEFTPECDVPNEDWANFLLTEAGEFFVRIEQEPQPKKPFQPLSEDERALRHTELVTKATGKRFTGKAGKWNAFAYLKKNKLTKDLGLKKLQIGDKVVHWELVPVTLADVGAEAAPVPWNKPTKGAQEVVNESVNG